MKYTYNDGGRASAGYSGKCGDCVTRAVAIATQQPYEQVYRALAEVNAATRQTVRRRKSVGKRSARNGVYTGAKNFKDYMQSLGWKWTPTMRIGGGCQVHLCRGELPLGRLIVRVSKHYCAVIDGELHDTHDCSRGGTRCVYGYWSTMDTSGHERTTAVRKNPLLTRGIPRSLEEAQQLYPEIIAGVGEGEGGAVIDLHVGYCDCILEMHGFSEDTPRQVLDAFVLGLSRCQCGDECPGPKNTGG